MKAITRALPARLSYLVTKKVKSIPVNPLFPLVIMGLLLCIIGSIMMLINHAIYQFPGNNYIPDGAGSAGISLIIIYLSLRYYVPQMNYLQTFTGSVLSIYATMLAIAFMTNACQYTPFSPIDNFLLPLDALLPMNTILTVANNYPFLKSLLMMSYNSLSYQLTLIPLMFAFFLQTNKLQQYLLLMLVSTLIGFCFYYLFPTTAPASNIHSLYFLPEQYATGLKYSQIHHHITPSTREGGMIALPSFHVIWAYMCLYLVRGCRVAFAMLLPINILLAFACVMLGWHYLIDLVGSAMVILMTHLVCRVFGTDCGGELAETK